jgi:hypothetical protein
MPVKQIVADMLAHGLVVNKGSVANIGTRLQERGVITRPKGQGWTLMDSSRAPVLNGKYAWGDPEMFIAQELAARRREAIVHVLRHFRDGLQNMQILTQLEGCTWLKTPLTKDLVKMDMLDLQHDVKVRRGSSRKWTLVETSER